MDVSLRCQFATWMFRYHLRWFATWTFRYRDGSPPERFAPLDVSIPGRFAISLDVSLLFSRQRNVIRRKSVTDSHNPLRSQCASNDRSQRKKLIFFSALILQWWRVHLQGQCLSLTTETELCDMTQAAAIRINHPELLRDCQVLLWLCSLLPLTLSKQQHVGL